MYVGLPAKGNLLIPFSALNPNLRKPKSLPASHMGSAITFS